MSQRCFWSFILIILLKYLEKKIIYVLNPFSKYSMNPLGDEKLNINTSCGREELGIY